MANPFRRADRDGAPSIRPTPPASAETPMPDPTDTHEILVETLDQAVNRQAPPPSAETPMKPPPAPTTPPVNRPEAPASAETPMEPPHPAPPPTPETPPAEN